MTKWGGRVATWIGHLRIAENLLDMIAGLDAESFAIGSVAPDSGIPDENWENFDPPPSVTHFKTSPHSKWAMADLDFFRGYLSPIENVIDDRKRFSFLLGYFFHLVTDNMWAERIGHPIQERFKVEFENDSKFIWQVKRDWYGLDFEHIRNNPKSIFWRVFLGAEFKNHYLDLMPREAVQQSLEYIKELYQRADDEIEEWYGKRPNKYLSESEMDQFIESATTFLYDVYEGLFVQKLKPAEATTVLDLALNSG
jgi:hypothetical protein